MQINATNDLDIANNISSTKWQLAKKNKQQIHVIIEREIGHITGLVTNWDKLLKHT